MGGVVSKPRSQQPRKSGKRWSNARAAERVIDAFGADFAVNLLPHPERPRGRVLIDMTRCNRLLPPMESIILYDFPADPPRLVCLWDRAYPRAHQARTVLRRALLAGGIEDRDVAHIWAVPEIGKQAFSRESMAQWWTNTLGAIDACNSRYVLILGAAAMKLWRNDLKISQVNGHMYTWRSRWIVFPVMSPLSVVADRRNYDPWKRGMLDFAMHFQEDNFMLRDRCVWHEGHQAPEAELYDRDGVPLCLPHNGKLTASGKGQAEWEQMARAAMQTSLM